MQWQTPGFVPHQAKLGGQRVLVVENEALVAMAMEDALMDAGAEVVGPAYSVDAAMELIEVRLLDGGLNAAVLDINLDGEVVGPIADRLAALGIPFVFATGYADTHGVGYDAPLLQKPFEPGALVRAVEALACRQAGQDVTPCRGVSI